MNNITRRQFGFALAVAAILQPLARAVSQSLNLPAVPLTENHPDEHAGLVYEGRLAEGYYGPPVMTPALPHWGPDPDFSKVTPEHVRAAIDRHCEHSRQQFEALCQQMGPQWTADFFARHEALLARRTGIS